MHLSGQCKSAFALLFVCPVSKALIFAKIGLKLCYLCKKITKSPRAETAPPDPLFPAVWGVAPKPPVSGAGASSQ